MDALLVTALLQTALGEMPYGSLFLSLLALGAVVFVGRLLLRLAWRLVTIALVVVGALMVVSMVAPGLV
ncbi:hypothetical protein AUR64_16025 [Haloprofundus marisrubri]|uniref:Uncharacterized protein n=1 Tax=Haloprofundus marisrubri TaxID=1514971 RepID=A0A0W1R7B2_9EURY|nr:hypothetical protein [Haloprofundus marisrubri]KTG09290.1 hypothetical protein AUR64_16025 [Haloprofundus marisrubri]